METVDEASAIVGVMTGRLRRLQYVSDTESLDPGRKPAGTCGAHWAPDTDGPTLQCRMVGGHDGTHQAYYGNRLHEWQESR